MGKQIIFKEKIYKEAFHKNIIDSVKNQYGIGKAKNLMLFIRDLLVNYTPIIGHFPITLQILIRNNFKRLFGGLDIRVSTLSSAFITLILAGFIGIWLDGFDIGYNEEVSRGWWSAGVIEYRSYIGQYLPFLGLEFGFPKVYTLIFSMYLLFSSAARIIFNLIGRPIGTPLLEIPISIMNNLSEKSRYKKEAEEAIKDSQKLSNTIDTFIEKDRRYKEKILCEETLKIFKRSVQ